MRSKVEKSENPSVDLVAAGDIVHEVIESIENAHMGVSVRDGGKSAGVKKAKRPTGFTLVRSRSAHRSSDAAAELVRQMISKKSVLVFSLSEDKHGFLERLISKRSGVPLGQIRTGFFSKWKWRNLTRAAAELSESPLYLTDARDRFSGSSPASISRRLVSDLKAKGKRLGLIVVDGLKTRDFRDGHANLRGLERASRTLKVPVVAFSSR